MHLHYLTKEELRTIELARQRTGDGLDDVLAIVDRLDKVVLEHERQKNDREYVFDRFKAPRGAYVAPSPLRVSTTNDGEEFRVIDNRPGRTV